MTGRKLVMSFSNSTAGWQLPTGSNFELVFGKGFLALVCARRSFFLVLGVLDPLNPSEMEGWSVLRSTQGRRVPLLTPEASTAGSVKY